MFNKEILEEIDSYFKDKELTPKIYKDKLIAFNNVLDEITKHYNLAIKDINNQIKIKCSQFYNQFYNQFQIIKKQFIQISFSACSKETIIQNFKYLDIPINKEINDFLYSLDKIINYLNVLYSRQDKFLHKIKAKLDIILNKYNLSDDYHTIAQDITIPNISNELINDLKSIIPFILNKKQQELNIINNTTNTYVEKFDNDSPITNILYELYSYSKRDFFSSYERQLFTRPILFESLYGSSFEKQKLTSKLLHEFQDKFLKLPENLQKDTLIKSNIVIYHDKQIKDSIYFINTLLQTISLLKKYNSYNRFEHDVETLLVIQGYLIKYDFNENTLKQLLTLDNEEIRKRLFNLNFPNNSDIKELLIYFLKKANYDTNTTKLLLRHSNNILIVTNLLNLIKAYGMDFVLMLFKSLKSKDHNFIIKTIGTISSFKINYKIINDYMDIIEKYTEIYVSNEHFYKLLNTIELIDTFIHNNLNVSKDQTKKYIEFFLINKIDPSQDFIQKIFLITNKPSYKALIQDKELILLCKKLNINHQKLIEDYSELCDLFNSNKISIKNISYDLKEKVFKLSTNLELLLNYETVSTYISKAKPKNQALFKLNYTIDNNLHFKVLEDLSFDHFTIRNRYELLSTYTVVLVKMLL